MLELAPGALVQFSKARGGRYFESGALISFINFWPQNDTFFLSSYAKTVTYSNKMRAIARKVLRGTTLCSHGYFYQENKMVIKVR